jgi:RHS repeat-associated protein
VQITFDGGLTVAGDSLQILPEGTEILSVSAVHLLASGIPEIVINHESYSVAFAGLMHASVGDASVSVQSNKLTVANLGSSGQDGVAIAMPTNALAWAAQWEPLDPNGTLPVGAYLEEKVIGTGGPVTNGLLGTLTATKAGSANYVVGGDFSPLGVSNLTVLVYNGTSLVAQTNVAGGVRGVFTNLGVSSLAPAAAQMLWMPRPPPGPDDPWPYPWPDPWPFPWPNPWPPWPHPWPDPWPPFLLAYHGGSASFSLNPGDSVAGDTLWVLPQASAQVACADVEVVAAQIPSITITHEAVAVLYRGLTHVALGNAAFSDGLVVGNIGADGIDGVAIAMPTNTAAWAMQWEPLDPDGTVPVGAYLREQAIGSAGLVTNGVLGTLTTTKAGPTNYVIAADFSAIGASTYVIEAYRQGVLVAQVTNHSGQLAVASLWPDSFDGWLSLSLDWDLPGGCRLWFENYEWSVDCDHLFITPAGGAVLPDHPTAVQITASQIPSITITNETVMFALVWSGAVNGNWDLGATANWTSAGPPATYTDGDSVTFDDTASGPTTVNLTTTLSPAGVILNNSALNYTFTGAGKLSDSVWLTKNGSGVLTIANANDYTGATTVNAGTVLVNGKLGGGGAVSVAAGATLGGTGTINGPVTVQAGAPLAPGIGGIGTLTVSNDLTLTTASTTMMQLNKAAGTSDQVRGLTTVTYGGTLVVTNLAGTLAAGDSFKLFDAASYTGSFAAISPATPGIGIVWDMTYLPVEGTLRVAAVPPERPLIQVTFTGGLLVLAWPSGCTLQSANSLLGPWSAVPGAVSPYTVVPIDPTKFYRLSCQGPLTEPVTPFEPPQALPAAPGSSCGAAADDSLPYLFSGEFHHTVKDLVIKSRGMDFVWSRTYRSKVGQDTAIGNGWDFSYDIRVVANGPDFDVYDGTGRKDTYRLQTNGTYAADQLFCEGTLAANVFTVEFPDTGTWEFLPLDGSAAQGKISRIRDRNNNTFSLSYDLLGRLLSLVDTHGRTNSVSYNSDGFVSAITDFTGRQVTYAYYQNGDTGGSFGDLKSVTSPAVTGTPNGNDFPLGKTVTYTYSKGFADERLNHNLLTITDAKGQTWLRNTYAATTNAADYDFDRLLSQARGYSNEVLTFCYQPQSPAPANGFAITKAIVNDRMGIVSEHFYDATNRPVIMRQYTGRAVPGVTTTDTQNRPAGQLRTSDPSFFDIFTAWNSDSKPVSVLYPNGNRVTNIYESALNPSASHRARGNLRIRTTLPGPLGGDQAAITESFVYDTTFGAGCGCGFNFATQVTDGRGNTTYHAYDSHGNRTNTIHAVSAAVEDFEYNAYGQMTAHVLPDNGSGYRRRDVMTYYTTGPQAGYLHQQIRDSLSLALTTTYEYDAVGNVTRLIDPAGNDSTNVVNQLNQVVREYSRPVNTTNGPVRYQREFFYDANNNSVRLDVQNVDENGVVSTNAYLTTTYAYDILNRVTNTVQEVDPSRNVVTQYAYDANGNRTLVVNGEASNGHQPNNVVSTLYDERNLQYREVRAPGDPGQSTTQFDYDGNGNLIRTSQGLEDSAAPRVTTYAYDGFNRRTASTDPMGNTTTTHYDANGNILNTRIDGELVDVPGSVGNVRLAETAFTYDTMNRRVQTDQSFFDPAAGTNIAGGHALTTTVYSPNSQVLQTVDANSRTNLASYDSANRPSTVTDPKGNTRTAAYDADGNVVLTVEVDLSDLGSPAQTFYTTNVYDGQDRLVQTSDNLGNTTRFAYDSRNNRVALTDPRGNVTRYTYDGLNRLTTTTQILTSTGEGGGTPVGTIVSRRAWDDDSRLTSQTDANSNPTTYNYDPLGRLLRTVFADGTTNGAAYDVHGNPTATTDANANVVNATYDLLNRVTARAITRGPGVEGTTSEAFQYDGVSRTVLATNNDSRVTWSYDSLSHVTRETQQVVSSGAPTRTVVSTYDALGNRLSCACPGGRVINCTYDALNRKQAVSDSSGGIANYSYFGPGRVQRRDYGNGTRADYAYDGLRRMTNSHQSVIAGGAPIDSRAYAWDAAANQTTNKDLLAPSLDSRSFAYDSVNRLVTSQTAVVGPTISYSLDGVGNRLTVTGGTNAGPYFMSPAVPPADFPVNQYTTTPFDARAYDANGNLVSAGAQQFYYDYRNQLVEVWQAASTNTVYFKYDCFGRRLEKATPTTAERYYYAGWREIEEQSSTNGTVATSVWGNGIDELLEKSHGGSSYYYHADDLGNIQKVTDASGDVVEQYRYGDYGQASTFDSSGAPLAGSMIGNSTLFTGRRYDPETGFYYYRTRYLDPAAGRFITRDTIGIWGDETAVGNGYTYVANNPTSFVDPSGEAVLDLGCDLPVGNDITCHYGVWGILIDGSEGWLNLGATCHGTTSAAECLKLTKGLYGIIGPVDHGNGQRPFDSTAVAYGVSYSSRVEGAMAIHASQVSSSSDCPFGCPRGTVCINGRCVGEYLLVSTQESQLTTSIWIPWPWRILGGKYRIRRVHAGGCDGDDGGDGYGCKNVRFL